MNHLNFYSLIKEVLLLVFSIFISITSLFAENPKEMIRDFVEAQDREVTAYDIAAHFNAPMTDPVYGAPNVFNVGSTYYISIAALDATHFVVAYRDPGNFAQGTAIVGQISGTTIQSYGSENVFNAGNTSDISVAALDATHFVVAYLDFDNSSRGTAIVGQVSGTTIQSYGSENVFNGVNTTTINIAALDATHFVVTYRDQGNTLQGIAIVGVVSGTTIQSYGSPNPFSVGNTSVFKVAALDATHFVVGYSDPNNSAHGTAIVGQVSGTTIQSYGSKNVFNAASTGFINIAALDATHFVVAYQDQGNSNHGTAIVGQVSGTTIQSYGSENVFNALTTSSISVAALDVSSFVVTYYDGNYNFLFGSCTSGPCTYQSIIGDVSGTTITGYGNEVEIDNSSGNGVTNLQPVANIGSFVVGFRDLGTGEGTGIVASTPALPVELVRFEAKGMESDIQLSWQTASEFNNQGFEIERVSRQGDWESIGFVEGDIYAVTTNDYTFIDREPLTGLNYYRLKQVDLDGDFDYSEVVSVLFHPDSNQDGSLSNIKIAPNPTRNGAFTLYLSENEAEIIEMTMYDYTGSLVRQSNLINLQTEIEVTDLQKGMYLVKVEMDGLVAWERVVIQ